MRIFTADAGFRIKSSYRRFIWASAVFIIILSFWTAVNRLDEISETYNRIWALALVLGTAGTVFKVEADGWPRYFIDCALICLIASLVSTGFDVFQGASISSGEDSAYYFLIRNGYAFLIALSLYLIFYALIGRIRAAGITATVLWFVMAVISYVVITTRGERLLFSDILGVGTALEVVDSYKVELNSNFYLGATVFAVALLWCFQLSRVKVSRKRRWAVRLFSLAAGCLVYVFFSLSEPTQYFYSWLDNQNAYLYHFMVNEEMLKIKKPEGYSQEKVAEIIDGGQNGRILRTDYNAKESIDVSFPYYKYNTGTDNPNIIVIMNESFTDLRTYGDLETSESMLENFDQIKEESIYGTLYTEVYGGGTADSEYSFFTGNSLFMTPASTRPYQLYVRNDTPSLVSTLNSQGYVSSAIHPMPPENWNRSVVYPLLGFENFYSLSSFPDAETSRSQNIITDSATYDKVIELYENKGKDPLFLFDLTMQNHGGYGQSYDNLEQVQITGSEGQYPETEQFISLIRASDVAFGDLVDYFSDVYEPTVICMFGDHQPNLTDGFYEDSLDSSRDDLTLEEQQTQQETPFIIWANYDIPHEQIERMSVNYLSTLVAETAGVEETPYNRYLASLYQQIPVIDRKGIITSDGTYYRYDDMPQDLQSTVNDYKIVVYNNMIDPENRYEELFRTGSQPAVTEEAKQVKETEDVRLEQFRVYAGIDVPAGNILMPGKADISRWLLENGE